MPEPGASRGVLYPRALPTFHRVPVTGDAAVFVRWFWIPEWDVAPGHTERQHLIGFPACNLVVEDASTGIWGPTTRSSYRDLSGSGWAVGALLRPAAVPTLAGDVGRLRDTSRSLRLPDLHSAVRAAMTADAPRAERHHDATSAFAEWLLDHLGTPSEEALLANRMVAAAETDARLLTVTALAAELRVSQRSAQRLAAKYVGLPPAALIRRRRLQEAAEQLRLDPGTDLTSLAHRFGYADHAHLTNDFRSSLGITPSDYRRARPDA
ncbi:helix-turn-helix domain-containing protein [Curtobacterium sp. 22159]|uniref:helix-turn-helix domain-containing protein n=1 Tax=Curtobacterium sp. 22159 TaxID=3453882 RepID=UPI003F863B39